MDPTVNVEHACHVCTTNSIVVEAVQLPADVRDQWDLMASILPARGWAVRSFAGIGRKAVCPDCQKKQDAEPVYPPYEPKCRCPKCRAASPLIRFCQGLTIVCNAKGEHLHRTCQTCGYDWKQAVAELSHVPISKWWDWFSKKA